jgi:NAD(P)H dehydrogenase (quinone)
MVAVTDATSQLGQLVITYLLQKIDPKNIIGLVSNLDNVESLKVQNVQVRQADYSKPETLTSALSGVDKLLLILSSEVDRSTPPSKNIIEAVKKTNIQLIVYTSFLHSDISKNKNDFLSKLVAS